MLSSTAVAVITTISRGARSWRFPDEVHGVLGRGLNAPGVTFGGLEGLSKRKCFVEIGHWSFSEQLVLQAFIGAAA